MLFHLNIRQKIKTNIMKWVLILSIFLILIMPVKALLDPATVYCQSLGYNYTINQTEYGEQGICILPNDKKVDEWDFLEGKVENEYSYCRLHDYNIKTVNGNICNTIFSEECAVCILENGTEVEVTTLMRLSFQEGRCGDGRCTIGENYDKCPQDCPSGGEDTFCDGIADGICDPDCIALGIKENDPDCITTTTKKTTTTIQLCNKNKKCEPILGENYNTCSPECPSGSKDDYCDKVSDGICDPDCTEKEDFDCKKPSMLWFYIVIGIVIIVLLVLFFTRIIREKEIGRPKQYPY